MEQAVPKYITNYYLRRHSKVQFILLCLLLMSFFYELPVLIISNYDRLNPRPFDLLLIINVIYHLFTSDIILSVPKVNIIFNLWLKITLVFIFCGTFWWIFLPSDLGNFSAYFTIKYIQSLIALYLFLCKPFSKKQFNILVNLTIAGGMWVALATYLQVFGIFQVERYLPTGEKVAAMEGAFYSTLGTGYMHTGMLSVLTFCLIMAKYKYANSLFKSIFYSILALICIGPALISGSRASLLALFIVTIIFILIGKKRGRLLYLSIMFLTIGFYLISAYSFPNLDDTYFKSIQRWVQFAADGAIVDSTQNNSVAYRLLLGPESILKTFEATGFIMLIFGAGFYVAPYLIDGFLSYRIGYGNHNIFLFPLEQGGIVAFVISTVLFVKMFIIFNVGRKLSNITKEEKGFILAVFTYYIAFLLVGYAGQTFWFVSGMEHFVVYQMIIFSLASSIVFKNKYSSGETKINVS